MSWLPSGTVYGTLLNQRSEYEALAPQMHDAPYQAPPKAPVAAFSQSVLRSMETLPWLL